jgi:hypothetical protein
MKITNFFAATLLVLLSVTAHVAVALSPVRQVEVPEVQVNIPEALLAELRGQPVLVETAAATAPHVKTAIVTKSLTSR